MQRQFCSQFRQEAFSPHQGLRLRKTIDFTMRHDRLVAEVFSWPYTREQPLSQRRNSAMIFSARKSQGGRLDLVLRASTTSSGAMSGRPCA